MKNKIKKTGKKVALFAKDKYGLKSVVAYLKSHFKEVDVFIGSVGDDFPRKARGKKYDICVSYMSPWIIPGQVLDNTQEFAINFHPGPPEYRGIGCTNFAVYNNAHSYGVTAHHMHRGVDCGKIVTVKRFPVLPHDTLLLLTEKCYRHILRMFREVFDNYLKRGRLMESNEKWSRKLYTRKELNDLCKVRIGMPAGEVMRRIKATNFPNMPKAYIELHGHKFEFKEY